jgi:hypothetical protein
VNPFLNFSNPVSGCLLACGKLLLASVGKKSKERSKKDKGIAYLTSLLIASLLF